MRQRGKVRVLFMLPELDPYVKSMASIRFLSASIEMTAALLMLKFNRVETSLQINGLLGMVGPLAMLAVTVIGVVGLAGRLPLHRLILILAGVTLILAGTRE